MLIALKDKWWDSTQTFWRSLGDNLLVFEDEKEMNCGCGIFCFCFLFCCCHLLSVRLAQDKDLDGLENHKEFFLGSYWREWGIVKRLAFCSHKDLCSTPTRLCNYCAALNKLSLLIY